MHCFVDAIVRWQHAIAKIELSQLWWYKKGFQHHRRQKRYHFAKTILINYYRLPQKIWIAKTRSAFPHLSDIKMLVWHFLHLSGGLLVAGHCRNWLCLILSWNQSFLRLSLYPSHTLAYSALFVTEKGIRKHVLLFINRTLDATNHIVDAGRES